MSPTDFLARTGDETPPHLTWFNKSSDTECICIRPEDAMDRSCDVFLDRQNSAIFQKLMNAAAQSDCVSSGDEWSTVRQVILYGFYALNAGRHRQMAAAEAGK